MQKENRVVYRASCADARSHALGEGPSLPVLSYLFLSISASSLPPLDPVVPFMDGDEEYLRAMKVLDSSDTPDRIESTTKTQELPVEEAELLCVCVREREVLVRKFGW